MKKTGAAVDIEVKIDGPLFLNGPQIVQERMRDALEEIVEEGAQEAKRLAAPFRRTGRYMDSLRGKVAKSGRSGRIKAYGGPKKMPYSKVHEVGRSFASTGTRVRGHFVLKTTRQKLEGEMGRRILAKHMDRAIRELN